MKSPIKTTTAQHYNRTDIKSNTIDKINQRYSKLIGKMEQKSVTLVKSRENEEDGTFLTVQSHTLHDANDQVNRLTFGRNKISSNVRENLKEKMFLLDEKTAKGKSLFNPIQKLEKIKNTQKLNNKWVNYKIYKSLIIKPLFFYYIIWNFVTIKYNDFQVDSFILLS